MMMYVPTTYAWMQKNQQFRRYSRIGHFDYLSPHFDRDLENSKGIFSHISTRYIYHNTKFGYKRYNSLEGIV